MTTHGGGGGEATGEGSEALGRALQLVPQLGAASVQALTAEHASLGSFMAHLVDTPSCAPFSTFLSSLEWY